MYKRGPWDWLWPAAKLGFIWGMMSGILGSADAAEIFVEETRIITLDPAYHGWSTVSRAASGELFLVFSGGREAHVCPFGRVELMRSSDDGQTWSWPRVLYDGPIDDRDAGICVTGRGSLLVTTFTSLAYEDVLAKADSQKNRGQPWPASRAVAWQAVQARMSAAQRRQELGTWMLRSEDGGTAWSSCYRVPVNSPHGPTALRDGSLLYAGIALWEPDRRIGACRSTDDGRTWDWLADIPVRQGDDRRDYHELHVVEAADGRLVLQIRNHNTQNHHETLQSESFDGGQTWSEPHGIGVWGYPSHLLRLRDGRLLMTYGHRRKPLGVQARLSSDHGQTWSEALLLSGDGVSGDLGYPSTVQLDDGHLLTVWYEVVSGDHRAQLRQARWKLGEEK